MYCDEHNITWLSFSNDIVWWVLSLPPLYGQRHHGKNMCHRPHGQCVELTKMCNPSMRSLHQPPHIWHPSSDLPHLLDYYCLWGFHQSHIQHVLDTDPFFNRLPTLSLKGCISPTLSNYTLSSPAFETYDLSLTSTQVHLPVIQPTKSWHRVGFSQALSWISFPDPWLDPSALDHPLPITYFQSSAVIPGLLWLHAAT